MDGPLRGVGVAVTRDEPEGGPLAARLVAQDARVVRWPTVEVVAVDPGPLERSLERVADFDWIIFTSARAVEPVAARLTVVPANLRIAVVGEATARAVRARGWSIDCMPSGSGAAALVEAMVSGHDLAGKRVLFPASAAAAATVEDGLATVGAKVERVTVYEPRTSALDPARVRDDIDAGRVDVVTFTSPSAVRGWVRCLGSRERRWAIGNAVIVALGATTATAVAEALRAPHAVANPSTLDGLVAATVVAIAVRSPGRPRSPGRW